MSSDGRGYTRSRRWSSTAIGVLFAGERRGTDVRFAGHRWVALAADLEDPVTVTILHDVVDRPGLDDDVAFVGVIDDLYEVAMERTPDGYGSASTPRERSCRSSNGAVSCVTRYLTQAELDRIQAQPFMARKARHATGTASPPGAVSSPPTP